MIKVSIIIPIYKVDEKFLRKCIESSINQTLKDIEIILVDDGSPDNCGKICDEYAEKDKRIVVIHQENKGLCGARNTGVRQAKGEFITFVDGDDWIESKMCETLYNYSTIYENVDVITSAVIRDYGNKSYNNTYSKFEDKKLYQNNERKYWQKEILNHNANISGVYAKLINRELLINNNIFHNESLKQGAEGLEFNLRLFGKTKKIFFTKEYFYHYMYNPDSISASHNEKNHLLVLKCFETMKQEILEMDNKDELLEMFYVRVIYAVITTAISGYFAPNNPESYKVKKQKYKKYLTSPLVQESIKKVNLKNLDLERKIILMLIKLKLFRIINLLAVMRNKQKKSKMEKN